MGIIKTGIKAAVFVKTAAPVDHTSARLAQLSQLGKLRTSGILTNAEFEAQKARILGT